jgi:hypothetical protein
MARQLVTAFCLFILAGCAAQYATPGPGAPMQAFGAAPAAQAANTEGGIKAQLDKQPLAGFPAAVAVVRVQGPQYRSYTACGYGAGKYSVVSMRDVEAETDLAKLDKLPMLRGLAPLNRIVLPHDLESDYELRLAAARLHADILLLYTIDADFIDIDRTTPLSVLTLGATTTKRLRILCTASAALLDTRSGYVYGVAEGTETHEELQNAWKTDEEVDNTRRKVEASAFNKLVTNLQGTWGRVVQQYATARNAS